MNRLYLWVVLALVILAGASWLTYTITDAHWETKYNKLKSSYDTASAKAQAEARDTEQRYQNDIETIRTEGADRIAKAKADANRANASIAGLQQRINGLLASTSTEDSGTTRRGKTAGEALNLLADVLGKSIERNRQLASFADSAYSAGLTCEKSYDAIQR